MLLEKILVIQPFDHYKWEITAEIKIINGFKCYKAKTNEERFSKTRNKIIVTSPEVWFAPEIPYDYGPFRLTGLPGLVLEATLNGKVYYYATKIDLNYKGTLPAKMERPSKGKFVTENEMEDIQMKTFSGN